MKSLKIPNAPKTPGINFDPSTGNFFIAGISVPENSRGFYEPVISWLKEYVVAPAKQTTVVFKLSYVNTSSLQFIYDLLTLLNDINGVSSQVKVDWYYLEDDIDMQEMGENFKEAVDVDFNFFEEENV